MLPWGMGHLFPAPYFCFLPKLKEITAQPQGINRVCPVKPGNSEETTPVYCGCLQLQDPQAAMRREMAGPQGTPSSSPLSGYWICTDLALPQEILKLSALPGSQSYHWPSGSLLHGLG